MTAPSTPWRIEPLDIYGGVVDEGALRMTAKRYVPTESDPHGVTLLFAHCLGGHKELWEPTIALIFLTVQDKGSKRRIREAISFDYPTHGEAAVLNAHVLKKRTKLLSSYTWADAIGAFIKSHLQGHRLVGVGHSAGAGMLVLTALTYPPAEQPYKALILVEPPMVAAKVYAQERKTIETVRKFIMKGTVARRDYWPSKEAAFEVMSQRLPWSLWDSRVMALHMEYGFHATKDEHGNDVVASKTDKHQEAMTYPDVEPHIEAAERLPELCKYLPVHLIWGSTYDFINETIKDSLSDISEGRVFASITYVDGSGHLVALDMPDEVASAICACITGEQSALRSKL